MSNKIDITSTAIEKGIDLAKTFLEKLIIPPVEETGLLLKDNVTMWRFNKQVKMLIKAKEKCEKLGINPKMISLKILCPLLEFASLEENEILQDKWANLLTNMVDSEQNIQNHVFPYLLSQVSVDEFMMIETVYKMKVERVIKLEKELELYLKEKKSIEDKIKSELLKLEKQMKEEKENNKYSWNTQQNRWGKERQLRELESKERVLKHSIKQPELIPYGELQDYEISNLIRLGIVKSIPRPYAYVGEHRIRNEPNSDYLHLEDLEITIEAEADDFALTELGELFIVACNAKK